MASRMDSHLLSLFFSWTFKIIFLVLYTTPFFFQVLEVVVWWTLNFTMANASLVAHSLGVPLASADVTIGGSLSRLAFETVPMISFTPFSLRPPRNNAAAQVARVFRPGQLKDTYVWCLKMQKYSGMSFH